MQVLDGYVVSNTESWPSEGEIRLPFAVKERFNVPLEEVGGIQAQPY